VTVPILLCGPETPEELWLKHRRAGIGASEIAAVAGLARRRGPWDVWSSKVEGREFDATDEMMWGHWIEAQIISWWATRTGRMIAPGGLYRHPEHEWLIATPDALEVDEAGQTVGVVDGKNAGHYAADDWDDDGAPVDYICQITWQMITMVVRRGYLVAAIGGRPPVERAFDLDDDFARMLIGCGSEFWPLVQAGTPPPLDDTRSAAAWIVARYPDADPAAVVDLDEDDVALLAELVSVEEQMDALKQARRGVETAIKERLAEASIGSYQGRDFVTWKTVERAGYEVKPTTYRRLHIPQSAKKELSHGVDR